VKIEIQGQDAVNATEELLRIEGLQGSYETEKEVEREGILATIATIVGDKTEKFGSYQPNLRYSSPSSCLLAPVSSSKPITFLNRAVLRCDCRADSGDFGGLVK
jgi:hypothetical protein